jgi:hypothetical protein
MKFHLCDLLGGMMVSKRSINQKEKRLFKENPTAGRRTIMLALKALFEEKIRYQNNGEDGTDSNAFLHAYWSGLIAKNINEDWANRWTTAHEEDFNSLFTQMDLYNNSLGIKTAKENLQLSDDQLANLIENLVDLGKAKKIKNGILINSESEFKRNLNIFESILENALSLISKLILTSYTDRNKDQMTHLIFASNKGALDALKLIIGHSEIEAIDSYGETAIFHAARLKSCEVGTLLLNNMANPNAVNLQSGKTPLMEAVLYKNVEFANQLINHGAKIYLKDRYNFSAYDFAKQEGIENEFSFLKPS